MESSKSKHQIFSCDECGEIYIFPKLKFYNDELDGSFSLRKYCNLCLAAFRKKKLKK